MPVGILWLESIQPWCSFQGSSVSRRKALCSKMPFKREIASFEESEHPLNGLNLLTLLPLVWSIWIFHLNPPKKLKSAFREGKLKCGQVRKEADGSNGGRGRLWAPRGHHEATVCLEGRESEAGCVEGSERELVAETTMPTLQFCQGPWQMPGLPPKTIFSAVCNKLLIPEFKYQDYLKF